MGSMMEEYLCLEIIPIDFIKVSHQANISFRGDTTISSLVPQTALYFEISGDYLGHVNCNLIHDNLEQTSEKNQKLISFFAESMNILIGRQLSTDTQLKHHNLRLSSPKLGRIKNNSSQRKATISQHYQLQLDGKAYHVVTEYMLEVVRQ